MTTRSTQSSAQRKAARPHNVSKSTPAPKLVTSSKVPTPDAIDDIDAALAKAEEQLAALRAAKQHHNEVTARAQRQRELDAAEGARRTAALAPAVPGTDIPAKLAAILGVSVEQLGEAISTLGFPMRTDVVNDEDAAADETTETYEGTGMHDRLDAILALADRIGVITVADVTEHIPGKDGTKWEGNPVRTQLNKLVRQDKLVMSSCKIPRMSGNHIKYSPAYIWAKTDAQLAAYKAQLARGRDAKPAKS